MKATGTIKNLLLYAETSIRPTTTNAPLAYTKSESGNRNFKIKNGRLWSSIFSSAFVNAINRLKTRLKANQSACHFRWLLKANCRVWEKKRVMQIDGRKELKKAGHLCLSLTNLQCFKNSNYSQPDANCFKPTNQLILSRIDRAATHPNDELWSPVTN